MRTLKSPAPARRRSPRGPACEEPPRLWGEEAPARLAPEPPSAPPAPASAVAAPASSAPTLEDLIAGAWEGVSAGAAVACPVCAGTMAPRWSAGAGVVGGRCRDCATTLE